MKYIIIGVVVLCTAIVWAAFIFATDIEDWEREVHEFEKESSNENRPRDE